VRAKNAPVVVTSADQASQQRFVRVLVPRARSTRDEEADAYAELVLSLQPVAYYRMERPRREKDGDVLTDSAPEAHHGELHLGDEFGQPYLWGRFGQSLSLRQLGAKDYAIVPEFPESRTNELSFSAWVMAESRNPFAWIAGTTVPLRPLNRFRIFLMPAKACDLGVKVCQPDGTDAFAHEGDDCPFPLGTWQHVAVVADKSALRLYRNGREVAHSTCSGVLYDRPDACLGIGCQGPPRKARGSKVPVASNGWHGRLDEVALFHRALTSEQVLQLFEGPRPGWKVKPASSQSQPAIASKIGN
jgi:hypothetical protein